MMNIESGQSKACKPNREIPFQKLATDIFRIFYTYVPSESILTFGLMLLQWTDVSPMLPHLVKKCI